MLNQLRKGVKSLTAKVLLSLLVVSFAVWGIGDIFSFRLDARVAKVGDTEVSAERFADALARQQSRLSREAGQAISFDQLRQSGMAGAVLNGLIRDAAFEEELKRLGLSAPDAAVADAIRQNQAFTGPGGQFSTQLYQLALQQQGLTVTEFERLTRTLLAQEILLETVEAAAVAPPGVAQRIAAYRNERRGANLMNLTLDMAPEPGEPGPEALRSFYDENKDMFAEPERRWGEYLHIDAGKLMAELEPGEDELRAAYEAEKDRYATEETRRVFQITYPDRAAAEQAMERLVSGEATFASLAGERGLSEEDMDLGEVTAEDLPGAAGPLVFDEAEPGIIGPVELPAGFAVYQIREINEGGVAPFEEVRDRIAERLARDALLTRAPEIANRIEELRAAGKSMAEIAGETRATHGRFEGLAPNGTLADGSEAEGVVARQAFIEEVFAALDAEERDFVETEQGGYFLVMVRRIEPSHVPPLEEIRDRVAAAWAERQRLEALQERAAEITARLGEDASIWDVADELGVAVLPVPPFTRVSPPQTLPAALVERIFRARSGEGVFARAEDGQRVVVAQVSSVSMPPPEQIEAESGQIETALANSIENDLGEYFARAVVGRYDAQIEWGVVDEVFTRLGGSGTGQPGYPAM